MKKLIFELTESLKFALKSLRTNLLRTSLSLLGVTIGIFSIVAIYSAVDALNKTVLDSMQKFGQNTLYITRNNFMMNHKVPYWKQKNFPVVKLNEYQALKRVLNQNEIKGITFRIFMPSAKLTLPGKESVTGALVMAVSADYPMIQEMDFDKGRFFNKAEEEHAAPVIVLGADIKDALFGNENALGKTLRMYGKKLKIIGVLKKEGQGMGPSNDGVVYLPHTFARTIISPNSSMNNIIVAPQPGTDIQKLSDKIRVQLRKVRKLKPSDIDNFFIININIVKDEIERITKVLRLGGGFLALFSLLIGAFGIANIMFVSVKERTNQIGIQKALGAKKSFILWQFLFEAMFLSMIGGILGILLVWGGIQIINGLSPDMDIHLTTANIITGLLISSVIGILAGLLPAWKAAKLNPVDAIRTGI